jgi:hypothetical protein
MAQRTPRQKATARHFRLTVPFEILSLTIEGSAMGSERVLLQKHCIESASEWRCSCIGITQRMRATYFVLVLAMAGVFWAAAALAVLGIVYGRGFISFDRGGNWSIPHAVEARAGSVAVQISVEKTDIVYPVAGSGAGLEESLRTPRQKATARHFRLTVPSRFCC